MSIFQAFRIVFSKELRELLRDRRTLFFLIAPPIILPAIAILGVLFIGGQTAHYIQQGFPVTVINGQAAPGLMTVLQKSPALVVLAPGDTSQTPLITLIIPDDFDQTLQAGQTAHLKLTQRDNTYISTLALGAVRSEISTYNNEVEDQRLQTAGHDRAWLSPISVDETQAAATATSVTAPSTAGAGSNNTLGALFLPLAVTSWLVGGGLGLIVDTTVGEKERQTIELVLVTPANRVGIVLGKLTVVFIASLVVMGLWMVEGLLLSILADVGSTLGGQGTADLGTLITQSGGNTLNLLLILLLLLLPFIIALNSLVMAFCSFANSYRESNVFLFLLQLALPAMVLLAVFSIGPNAGIGWYAAPILGTIIAIRDLFSQTLVASGLIIAVSSTILYAIAALALASYVYSREWPLARGIQ